MHRFPIDFLSGSMKQAAAKGFSSLTAAFAVHNLYHSIILFPLPVSGIPSHIRHFHRSGTGSPC